MPAIDPNVLQCVFYIYPTEEMAKAGLQFGGSGFFVARQFESLPVLQQMYAVTNRHCVKKCGPQLVLRVTKTDGTSDYLTTNADDWIEHPDLHDVAILPIDLATEEYEYNYLSCAQFFLTRTIVSNQSIGPGDDIFMVGRFIGQDGKQRNLPTVRSGIISRMNGEPIQDEYGINQDSFLVEMRSLSGYSGSPVFVYINPTLARPPHFLSRREPQRYSQVFHGPWLLGVDWCHLSDFRPVLEDNRKGPVQPKQWVEANSGMAGVIPVWRIQEILDLPELVMQRKIKSNELTARERNHGAAISDFMPGDTQKTKEGLEIPIPDKDQFFGDLGKASRKKG